MIRPPELSDKAVHIWPFHSRATDQALADFERCITPDEAERAARFRLDEARNTYIVTRGVLRHLLGCYLAVDPMKVRFAYTPKGKPLLESSSGLHFNVTHSNEMAAIAITAGCPIGIDMEAVRSLPHWERIAKRFFRADEVTEIMSASPGERESCFFRCWVRKEAYIKATGQGLFLPLDSFQVTETSGAISRIVHRGSDARSDEAWTLHDLDLAAGYASALVYQDQQRSVSVFPVDTPDTFHEVSSSSRIVFATCADT